MRAEAETWLWGRNEWGIEKRKSVTRERTEQMSRARKEQQGSTESADQSSAWPGSGPFGPCSRQNRKVFVGAEGAEAGDVAAGRWLQIVGKELARHGDPVCEVARGSSLWESAQAQLCHPGHSCTAADAATGAVWSYSGGAGVLGPSLSELSLVSFYST